MAREEQRINLRFKLGCRGDESGLPRLSLVVPDLNSKRRLTCCWGYQNFTVTKCKNAAVVCLILPASRICESPCLCWHLESWRPQPQPLSSLRFPGSAKSGSFEISTNKLELCKLMTNLFKSQVFGTGKASVRIKLSLSFVLAILQVGNNFEYQILHRSVERDVVERMGLVDDIFTFWANI